MRAFNRFDDYDNAEVVFIIAFARLILNQIRFESSASLIVRNKIKLAYDCKIIESEAIIKMIMICLNKANLALKTFNIINQTTSSALRL